MIVCLYEDRPSHLTGVRVALATLQQHCPGIRLWVNVPDATVDFRRWFDAHCHGELVTTKGVAAGGWNTKPHLLLAMLDRGENEAVWFDADILVTADWRPDVAADHTTLVATEETYWGQHQGGTHRAVAWGLQPGRPLPSTVNTALVRVTPHHEHLLRRWGQLLAAPEYLAAQRAPWTERPIHMLGDQEVLTGLLGSDEACDIPVVLLRKGRDIAHCFGPAGYTPGERIRNAMAGRPGPPLIHAMGARKPWILPPAEPEKTWSFRGLRASYDRLHCELSPYTLFARQLPIDTLGDTDWVAAKTRLGTMSRWVTRDHPSLGELPLATVDAGIRRVRRRLGVDRYEISTHPD